MFETMTIEVTPEEVLQLVKEAVQRQFGVPVTAVSIDAGTETQGFGFGERDVFVFRGVVVKLGPRPSEPQL